MKKEIEQKNLPYIKAFFRQKFIEAFEEVERKSFKDENYTGFRIIGDETFKEIKGKYL